MNSQGNIKRIAFAIIIAILGMTQDSYSSEFWSPLLWTYSISPDVKVPKKGIPVYVSMRVRPGSGSLSGHVKGLYEQYALRDCSSTESMTYPISHIISCVVPEGHESFWKEFLVKLPWVDDVSITFGQAGEVSIDREMLGGILRKLPTGVAKPVGNPLITFRKLRNLLKKNYEQMKIECEQRGQVCVEVAPDREDYVKITIQNMKGVILKHHRYWERLTIQLSLFYGGNVKLSLDAKFASGMNEDREPPAASFYATEYKFPQEVYKYFDDLMAKLSYIYR